MDISAHDPVDLYRLELKERFAGIAHDFLRNAVISSGVDEVRNAVLARETDALLHKLENAAKKKRLRIILLILLPAVLIAAGCALWLAAAGGTVITPVKWLAAGTAGGIILLCIFFKLIPDIRRINKQIIQLDIAAGAKKSEAEELLKPFFEQFTWNTVTELIQKTLPILQFDTFLPECRVNDLFDNFGMERNFISTRSVLYTHSGTLYGYPFVFLETNSFHWEMKTYTGTLPISWRAREVGSDGKWRTVTRHEVLTASVTKPYPVFTIERALLYGNDAAPELSFSRTPSALSGNDSFLGKMGKSFKMKKLRKLEQNLEDDLPYTMLGNRDFELLFASTDRNDEVGYRLLFTPLAQQNMVKLLNDEKSGYGDDFTYFKSKKMTSIISEHLSNMPFATSPVPPAEYDLCRIQRILFDRYCEFFRSVYFAIAPLLAIPVYNEQRPVPADAKCRISSWELENLANHMGEVRFRHPESITGNLLKVHNVSHGPDSTVAAVTATGFRGEKHLEHIPCTGGDGEIHSVPVEWIKYIPVTRTTSIKAARREDMPDIAKQYIRRGIAAL